MIKRFDLTITEPLIISPPPRMVMVDVMPEAAPVPDLSLDPGRIRDEMANIVMETEAMVKDLMEKAAQDARSILEDAQEDAEVLKTQAQKEAEEIRIQAQKEGYENGLREAHQEIEADRQMAMEQCQQILEEARRNKVKLMESSTTDMARLAIAVAKRVISTEVNTNPQVIISVIREAINLLDQPGNFRVYVNPEEIESALDGLAREEISEMEKQDLANALVADARVGIGGCVIESDQGVVDAKLDTRIAKVEQALQDVSADDFSENI
ncbi:MAG: FliH/SctL family protein [Syntrophomonadaceae bacterium]